jgi:hypothetical protein
MGDDMEIYGAHDRSALGHDILELGGLFGTLLGVQHDLFRKLDFGWVFWFWLSAKEKGV